jgi:hypothetical protein
MTDKHPLTDEVIYRELLPIPLPKCFYRENDLRAAADWQLEQVIKFMEEHEQLFGGSGMIFILKDAMRPTTQEDN